MILPNAWIAAAIATVGFFSAPTPGRSARLEPAADKAPLRVLYVGNHDSPRGREYLAFLEENFAGARAAAREGFDPALAADFDVVLLDWSQSDVDIRNFTEAASPLGPRDRWNTPTVLLGSAGLLMSGPWEIAGGYG